MKIKKLIIVLLLCNISIKNSAAEGGCPFGQTPKQFGPTMGCAPGGNDHVAPQPSGPKFSWENRWGAIAESEESGPLIVGVSSDQKSKRKAKKAAIEDCESRGGKNCTAEFTYRNQCASIVAGEKSYHISSSESLKKSIEIGETHCHKSGDTKCKIEYTNCTEPVLIRN